MTTYAWVNGLMATMTGAFNTIVETALVALTAVAGVETLAAPAVAAVGGTVIGAQTVFGIAVGGVTVRGNEDDGGPDPPPTPGA